MMRKNIFVIMLIVFALMACKTDEIVLSTGDYLVFGHFYGECMGKNCVLIYRLEENRLLKDTTHVYPGSADYYKGKYIQLTQQQYDSVKNLVDYFPSALLNEKDKVIGSPDAGDWGGLYVEYNYRGVHRFWLLDQMKSNVSTKYHEFIDKINQKISILQ